MKKIPLIVVVGPTASGKTALAVDLALIYGGEVVSADSMQIYKGMPIASAVPGEEERRGVVHHLMEFLPPSEPFTVADFCTAAAEKIRGIDARGSRAILAGGTGLYINSLVDNVTFAGNGCDPAIRKALSVEAERSGIGALYERLRNIDPETAARLHENDRRRIIRALELYETSGLTITEQNRRSHAEPSPYDAVFIGLNLKDRERLYGRIDLRVDKMVENGLEDEARAAFEDRRLTAAAAIGHKELFPYFKGEITLDEAIENLKRATRRYAKRQLTWFGRDERINWIYADECEDVTAAAAEIINKAERSDDN